MPGSSFSTASARPIPPRFTISNPLMPRAANSVRSVRSYTPEAIVPGVAITPTAKGGIPFFAFSASIVAATPAFTTPITFTPFGFASSVAASRP